MTSKECLMITPDLSRAVWHKSSYSTTQGNCVEVAWVDGTAWHKSSYSSTHGNCVEVAMGAEAVAVRDSKNVVGPMLAFPADAWHGFLADRVSDLG
ncbi:MAG TPA: DUF397 domain-containing protein [Pseudonocardiaceae bacterium]|jgi:nitrite reductase/ring-hydroxylating ferredoxin subunit|nr:DUF397 domain-containing protein [Pseudonocardiaceae bacterium]